MSTIIIKNVHKSFKKDIPFLDLLTHPFRKPEIISALRGVSLSVKKGECFGLLGPNGAGKTTLLKTVGTLLIPDKGSVLVDGFDVVQDEYDVKQRIGFVHSEERSFFWRLTARQNLEFFAALHDLEKPANRINELLDLVGLSEKADIRFDSFSTGMKHKLSIARGLLSDPDVLLVDELTSGIDPNSAYDLRNFIKKTLVKKMKKTVLLSTHDLNEAKSICDKVAILDKGLIKIQGTLSEIYKKTGTRSFEKAFRKVTLNA